MISNMDFFGTSLFTFIVVVLIVRCRVAVSPQQAIQVTCSFSNFSANVSTDERSLVAVFLCVNRVFERVFKGFTRKYLVPKVALPGNCLLGIFEMSC